VRDSLKEGLSCPSSPQTNSPFETLQTPNNKQTNRTNFSLFQFITSRKQLLLEPCPLLLLTLFSHFFTSLFLTSFSQSFHILFSHLLSHLCFHMMFSHNVFHILFSHLCFSHLLFSHLLSRVLFSHTWHNCIDGLADELFICVSKNSCDKSSVAVLNFSIFQKCENKLNTVVNVFDATAKHKTSLLLQNLFLF
jgi:hypothetical protein